MRAERAIAEFERLELEAGSEDVRTKKDSGSWHNRVRVLAATALGEGSHIVSKMDSVRYSPSVMWSGMGNEHYINAFRGGMREMLSLIEAAIYELKLGTEADEPVDGRSFDPELWDHVKGLVEADDWGKVASQTAIFVEDRLRLWSGLEDKYGKGLVADALSDNAELRLGQRKTEWEGWRSLAIGFSQAIGNVDRHRIQERGDARRYAIGALGAGSLILTQIRYEHAEIVDDARLRDVSRREDPAG